MLKNICNSDELRSLAARNKKNIEFKTVPKSTLDSLLADGWKVIRENRNSVRVSREKRSDIYFEHRVWSLLYKMGFTHFSGNGGAYLVLDAKNQNSAQNQIDIVAIDNEVAIAIECKSSNESKKKLDFQKDIAKHQLIRDRFSQAVNKQFPLTYKRVPVLILFTWNLVLTDQDIQRAAAEKIVLLNENDLKYYEQLVAHLGVATKYQFFADILSKRRIYGLETKVPALKTKMGRYVCYTFSIKPSYLQKIAYVSHRVKGKATDINTYQRMIKKSRLKKIRQYIEENGIFPTNIVINIDGNKHVRFEPKHQEGGPEGASYGTLLLTPSYGCAWVIDGQHRLFAYSGSERATTSFLNVLAFEGLPPSKQAELFIDINHEQKSVKSSLLHELYAELNWDDEDEDKRVTAIVSKAIQGLNDDIDSPFRDRILLADAIRTPKRCISLESIFKSLCQPGFYIIKKQVSYGPLWAGENDKTLKKSIKVIKEWFRLISERIPDWWELGSAEGGGLSMNDGATVCIGVLRSVFSHLGSKIKVSLAELMEQELIKEITPYGVALGEYFASFSTQERLDFRSSIRGIQGQTAGRRKCEQALNRKFAEFQPPGLKEDLELEAAKTNEQAYTIIQRISVLLRELVVDTLKAEYGNDENWWYNGVPPAIRKKIMERLDDAQGVGGREDFFDLVDYRDIATKNWQLFQDVLAYGNTGDKNKRTEWIVKLNDIRKIVAHPTPGRIVTWEQLRQLKEYEDWLNTN